MLMMWLTVSRIISTNKLLILASLVIVCYLLPYYILGEDMHIRVHDNLDSNMVWYNLLAESGIVFSLPNITLHQIINGLPRNDLESGLDAAFGLSAWFERFTAYSI